MIEPELLVSAYASGWFPMAVEGGEIRWFSPDPRGIIPLDTLPRAAAAGAGVCGSGRFEIAIDRAFAEVMRACAEADREPDDPAPGSARRSSRATARCTSAGWRTRSRRGSDGRLVGGLYGVALGGAFFGESMFHRETDASKVALVALVERLRDARLSAARHAVGHAAPRAVRRDRDPAARLPAAARASV